MLFVDLDKFYHFLQVYKTYFPQHHNSHLATLLTEISIFIFILHKFQARNIGFNLISMQSA